ncbi:D-alanyl-lipoteichoic acid acyltransferase DltB, MBOAT superfamily [Duganella sp. CF517]|uniref:MBOAT family O-acyltransferase n=1 Tax=Duganella sp. CF517 TaxID=1881038 RepID=UPI0008AA9745|nr:MBOAT family protein [Duganella sp. CF517]SEN80588.1 D-alanyl-lipoteichoic acid acyltransferase DltB, MBOAT superfamily [Duganella sp. CF517]
MLFNSFTFLFLYLPLVFAGHCMLARWRPRWIIGWLALASLFFYGYWDARYLPLLLASILFNYWCGVRIGAAGARRRRWLVFGLAANLSLLAYYKYANFFLANVSQLAGAQLQGWEIILPIGISFFTFTQIAFLVDCHRGHAGEYRLAHYTLFVSYFPHLIAGPVLHHKEMMPQFDARAAPNAADFAVGISIFVMGLAKKVLLADPLSALAGPVFAPGAEPQLIEAWIGALAYTMQLYFDFSGYSDMAIGLSRLFGVKLPLNFNSPYQAANIGEFWRRWHMTLSRFLRDYLYVPLGGNRRGRLARYRNLMLTMVLGGLWHGAGWTFVVWGALHGVYLVAHQAWVALRGPRPSPWWGRGLTFVAVMLAWVVFRAPDLPTAGGILLAMAGGNGVALPRAMAPHAQAWLALGVSPDFTGIRWIDFGGPGVPTLLLALALALHAPNTQQIFRHYAPGIGKIVARAGNWHWTWSPNRAWSLAFSLAFLGCLFSMNRVSEFLYFQF